MFLVVLGFDLCRVLNFSALFTISQVIGCEDAAKFDLNYNVTCLIEYRPVAKYIHKKYAYS